MQNLPLPIGRLAFAALLCMASAAGASELSLGAGLRHFDYEEFSTSGETLNRETGFLPGISAALLQDAFGLGHTFELAYWDGRVDYDGRTQGGQPHRTDTDETILQLQYRAGWQPVDAGGGAFAAVAWNRWDRDILPANGVSGLFERYAWWELQVGIEGELLRRETSRLAFEFSVLATRSGTIDIDLTDLGFGNNTLNLGDGQGLGGALAYSIDLSRGGGLQFRLEHTRWNFGRSNTRAISDGSTTIFITEPESDSSHTSFRVEYVHDF